jgi:hypothetical protein
VANNPLNSPWRLDPDFPGRVLGADGQFIALFDDARVAQIVTAAPQMYFALDAMLEANPDDDEEARNLGRIALAKAKGDRNR